MMIDCHVHITPPKIAANWQKYAEKEQYFSLLFKNNVAIKNSKATSLPKFASAEDIINEIIKKDSPLEKAVVFGFAFCDMGLCRFVNDYIIEKVKEYPDKLIGFCVVSPAQPSCRNETAKEIERCFNAGLKGVGELFPAGQNIDLDDIKQTSEITGVCKELGLPLLLHVNEPVGHKYAGKTEIPLKKIERFVNNNPELKIILAHFGGGLLFYETMPEIRKSFSNVYYDTAAAPFLYDPSIYNAAKALGLVKKILFGSDFPLLHQSRYMDAIGDCMLSNYEKQMILKSNAQRILSV